MSKKRKAWNKGMIRIDLYLDKQRKYFSEDDWYWETYDRILLGYSFEKPPKEL